MIDMVGKAMVTVLLSLVYSNPDLLEKVVIGKVITEAVVMVSLYPLVVLVSCKSERSSFILEIDKITEKAVMKLTGLTSYQDPDLTFDFHYIHMTISILLEIPVKGCLGTQADCLV